MRRGGRFGDDAGGDGATRGGARDGGSGPSSPDLSRPGGRVAGQAGVGVCGRASDRDGGWGVDVDVRSTRSVGVGAAAATLNTTGLHY